MCHVEPLDFYSVLRCLSVCLWSKKIGPPLFSDIESAVCMIPRFHDQHEKLFQKHSILA